MEEKIKELKYIPLFVDEQGNTTYVGYGTSGMHEEVHVWIIKKIYITSPITQILYAIGAWKSRATLNYK